jgi:hypothetical protein
MAQSARTIRFIDWEKAIQTLIALPAAVFAAAMLAGPIFHDSRWVVVVLLVVVLTSGIAALVAELQGYVFEPSNDRFSYPRYLVRRHVAISAIYDANCQTITTRRTSKPGEVIGDKTSIKSISRSYNVNLSGQFGLRHLAFSNKGRRDYFLSTLRQVAPKVRITRWS